MKEEFERYNFFKTPTELKEIAKEGIRGNVRSSLAINFIFFLSKLCLYLSLVFFVLIIININNYEFNLILFSILAITSIMISALTYGPLKISSCYHSINMVENTHPKFRDISFGFKNKYLRNVGYGFSLVFVYFFNFILLIVPFINKYIHFQLTGYILAEDKNMKISEAFRLATMYSKGHNKSFILLLTNFIPEFLLCIPTIYIYSLWLRPKYNATIYCYYKDLKK